jgi:hypothetical protein
MNHLQKNMFMLYFYDKMTKILTTQITISKHNISMSFQH